MKSLSSAGSLTLLSVACLTIMVGCVIVPGLPSIARALNVPSAAGWLVTIPSLGVVVFGPMVGGMIHRIGAKRTLLAGLALYGAIGYSCIWLDGTVAVLANRFLLGGATALVMSSGTALISELFDGEARLVMIARQGMSIELGGVVFLAIGGTLATLGWDRPFVLYLVAWPLFAMVLFLIPETAKAAPPATGHDSRAEVRGLSDIFVAAAFSMISFFAAIILLPGKLSALGLGEGEIGYFLAFVSLVAVVAAFLMPRAVSRLGSRNTLIAAFVLYAVSHMVFYASHMTAMAIGGSILLGGGFGLSVPLVNHETIERASNAARGKLLGYLSSAIFLGQFLSSFVEFVSPHGPTPFLLAAAAALIGLSIYAFLDASTLRNTQRA